MKESWRRRGGDRQQGEQTAADIRQGASRASKRPQTSGKVRAGRANGLRHPARCEQGEQTAADIRQGASRASKGPQTSGKVRAGRTAADIRQCASRASKRPQTSG